MTTQLDQVVQITARISAGSDPGPDFGRVLLVTTDQSISSDARVLTFDDLEAVGQRFTSGDILEKARGYFRQLPTPPPLKVGRWYKTAQASALTGGAHLSLAAIQALAGTWTLTVNGQTVTPATVATAADFAGVAGIIQGAVRGVTGLGAATVSFVAASDSFVLTLPAGTDFGGAPTGTMAAALGWTTGTIVNGHGIETVAEGLAALASETGFYWITVAGDIDTPDDIVAFGEWVTVNPRRYFIWDETDSGVLTTGESASTAARLSSLDDDHVSWMYGATADHKAIEVAGQFSSVDFGGSDTLLAIHGKRLAGSVGDSLSADQIAEIKRKNGNYYQRYSNAGYVVNGKSVDGNFIDVIYWYDWLVDAMQRGIFNTISSNPAVPQTPAGIATIRASMRGVLDQGNRNGGIAGGPFSPQVTANIRRVAGNPGFEGTTVNGYYLHIGALAAQSQADREARLMPPATVWLKGRGAIAQTRVNLLLEP